MFCICPDLLARIWCHETGCSDQVYAVLGHSSFLWMIKLDALKSLFHPGLSEILGLSNVDPPTHGGNVICSRCFQPKIIPDRVKGTDDLPRQEVYSSDTVFR
jgi:hypothetical protein